jgi:hypothetical protein
VDANSREDTKDLRAPRSKIVGNETSGITLSLGFGDKRLTCTWDKVTVYL